jgi:predicted RNA binding protein YcfA (HicA-like mRNA interferase family)
MERNSRKLIKLLKKDNWYLDRVKGSHHHFIHDIKPGIVTVPHPKRELPVKTVQSIYRQAQWKWPPK